MISNTSNFSWNPTILSATDYILKVSTKPSYTNVIKVQLVQTSLKSESASIPFPGFGLRLAPFWLKRHSYSHLYHTKVIRILLVKTSLKSKSESIPFPGFGLRSMSFKLRDIHIPIYIFHPRRAPILNWDENIIQILCKASFLFSKIPPGCWRGWTIYG